MALDHSALNINDTMLTIFSILLKWILIRLLVEFLYLDRSQETSNCLLNQSFGPNLWHGHWTFVNLDKKWHLIFRTYFHNIGEHFLIYYVYWLHDAFVTKSNGYYPDMQLPITCSTAEYLDDGSHPPLMLPVICQIHWWGRFSHFQWW